MLNARVVEDPITKKSLNYGYVQFRSLDEAKDCKKVLNNTEINGKIITVSVQVEHKMNQKANIFIRNIATTVS